jgi:hypothetical protein
MEETVFVQGNNKTTTFVAMIPAKRAIGSHCFLPLPPEMFQEKPGNRIIAFSHSSPGENTGWLNIAESIVIVLPVIPSGTRK